MKSPDAAPGAWKVAMDARSRTGVTRRGFFQLGGAAALTAAASAGSPLV
jgi:hypothetical protein